MGDDQNLDQIKSEVVSFGGLPCADLFIGIEAYGHFGVVIAQITVCGIESLEFICIPYDPGVDPCACALSGTEIVD